MTRLSSTPIAAHIDASLRATVLSAPFPCLGAKSAVNNQTYRLGVYTAMSEPASTEALASDLRSFAETLHAAGERELWSFAACFTEPVGISATAYEDALWDQLLALHSVDDAAWAPGYSRTPRDPDFAFSFAGDAFFVAGMHAGSPRWSRRVTWPTLIFNAHSQFEKLERRGAFRRFSEAIVARDTALQGTCPHLVVSFGDKTEAPHYASCADDIDTWTCPLGPHPFD